MLKLDVFVVFRIGNQPGELFGEIAVSKLIVGGGSTDTNKACLPLVKLSV